MAKSASVKRPMGRARLVQAGLSLVELLVALAVGAVLSVAILAAMSFGVRQDTVSSQTTHVNDNARAALTLLTRDVASAGFMFGAAQSQCAISITYNSNATPSFEPQHPIWASSQAAGQTLPMGGGNINYPAASNSNPGYVAQVLLMAAAPSVPAYIQQSAAPIYVVQFGTTQSSPGQGALNSTQLPVSSLQLNSTQGINAGDTAILQVPMNGGNVCMRIPIVKLGTTTGQGAAYIDSKPSPLMPTNGYSDYAAQIPASFGTLSNSYLLHSRILDLGHLSNTLQIIQYWIDASNGFPVLMRSTYSALDDSLSGTQAIAPGVVSLQVLFATVPAGALPGAAVTWKTWGNVLSSDQVLAADVALVLRSVHQDFQYTAPAKVVVPQPSTGLASPNAFVDYVPQANEIHDHFSVYVTQLALRNMTWN